MKTTPQETERKQDKQNAQNSGAGAISVQYQNLRNVQFVVNVETERRFGMIDLEKTIREAVFRTTPEREKRHYEMLAKIVLEVHKELERINYND